MVIIRLMHESEQKQVGTFVQTAMRDRYGSDAYALPEVTVTAWREEEPVGTFGLSLSKGLPFHVEELYAIRYETFPDVFERRKIAEFGRFVAKMPELAEALLYAGIRCALQRGCAWGIGEVRVGMARRYAKIGIAITFLEGKPIFANIPPGALPYYCVPVPRVAAMELARAAAALQGKVARLVLERRIAFVGC